MKKLTLLFLLYMLSTVAVCAQVRLLPLFTDNMVLQQQTQAPIWGQAEPLGKVTVTTSWNKKKYKVQADSLGNFMAEVSTPEAGGPYTVTISAGETVTLNNVMIGQVWVCSGQSNMEMRVNEAGNSSEEIANAGKFPDIRLLNIDKTTSPIPLDDFTAANNGWQVCSPATVANFSAAGYFFGRELNEHLDVPIGLINTSWGGTIIETWISGEALATMPSMIKQLEEIEGLLVSPQERKAKYEADVVEWKNNIEKSDKGVKDGKVIWADPDFDDSSWMSISVPGWMQENGLPGVFGLVWFRKTIDIPASWEGKELTLGLGNVDDNDFTWFNGVEVGHTEGWLLPRTYTIPASLVKAGKAVVTVRVMDTGGVGGIGGAPGSIILKLSDRETLPLAGEWKCCVSLDLREVDPMPVDVSWNPNLPTFLYNSMINPLIPYAIKGAIWYQGESNASQAYKYRDFLPMMIHDWRTRWGYNFPFYIVQLANYLALQTEPVESTWAELREAQTRTLNLENTGMAVLIDIGEANDIHPKNKQEVGRRLALAARAQTYGEDIVYSGPMYNGYTIEGSKIRLSFKHIGSGLTTPNGSPLRGFTIAGPDHKFHWADAVIDGNTVVVSSPLVDLPLAVRYAWADNPVCNLYNEEGLPASPFRTDDWKGVTDVGN